MSMYLLFSRFVAIYSFVAFSGAGALMTSQEYDDWKCGRICEGDLKDLVPQACFKLSSTIQNPYDEKKIKENSGCRPQTTVQFVDDNQSIIGLWRDVGICVLNDDETRCITMGKDEHDLLVYSYSGDGCKLLDDGRHFTAEVFENTNRHRLNRRIPTLYKIQLGEHPSDTNSINKWKSELADFVYKVSAKSCSRHDAIV